MDSAPPERVIAIWAHCGRQAELVRELKYGRATSVVTELADAMAARAPVADIVTWVPASTARRRRRGFDQGELLARAIARRRGVRVARLLRRRDDEAQTSRDLEGRLAGPEFVSAGRRLRFEPRVLLIDDVCTTGSTLRAAASVLLRRGAGEIVGLVATRAIPPSGSAKCPPGVYDQSTSQTLGG
jgi:predicted amidophosphoribosyltransferase